ncbi:hypothetical protein AAZX31_08G220900 [Glycine max]|nr:probable plastid-lipid-associated protein 10, chloroplastic isoform X4 [Glycine max]KAH1052554.1 hypothetical protein GYH30_022066 [Glycine max]KRH44669.2 hypothetical protein GLYMA_08G224600v4 [Glycine max]
MLCCMKHNELNCAVMELAFHSALYPASLSCRARRLSLVPCALKTRSCIEEALVSVEACNMASHPINFSKLDGTWRLQYTSSSDVLVLLQAAATLPFFQVGQIFQKFECGDQSHGGVIRNVVRWSIPNLLEEQEGATLLVSAKFNVVSVRNIYLQFQEITVQDIYISEELRALIAPAILPRSFISLQILQFLHTFKA